MPAQAYQLRVFTLGHTNMYKCRVTEVLSCGSTHMYNTPVLVCLGRRQELRSSVLMDEVKLDTAAGLEENLTLEEVSTSILNDNIFKHLQA